jgi:hypothetical protein
MDKTLGCGRSPFGIIPVARRACFSAKLAKKHISQESLRVGMTIASSSAACSACPISILVGTQI